jgi:hypothetical protein
LRLALTTALARDAPGTSSRVDPLDVEDEVARLRALVQPGSVVPLAAPVSLPSLGVLPSLLCLLSSEPFDEGTELEVGAALELTSVVSGAVIVEPAVRLAVLPGIGLHARGPSSLEGVLEAMSEPLRSPGAGAFTVVARVGPPDAPLGELRLEGTVRGGRLRVERVSPMAASWDWDTLAESLFAPFAAVAERRFPDAELHWASSDPRALATLTEDLTALGLADCEISDDEAVCFPRPRLGYRAVLAGARSLGVMPARE